MARLIVVSGPSGVGKTTIVKDLVRRRPDLVLSVSATTRAPRPGEQHGREYLFVDSEEFDRMVADDAFIETAEVHGERYGTPRAPVDEALRAGRTVILEIDVQGARQVSRRMPEALLVFVEPPGWEVLEERLTSRRTESRDEVARRLANARAELAAAGEFQVRIVNDDLDDAVAQLVRILESHTGTAAPAGAPEGETP